MIARLKQSLVVKAIYRLRDRPVLGAPTRALVWVTRIDWLQPQHLIPANRRHNAHQRAVLRAFEAETRARRG